MQPRTLTQALYFNRREDWLVQALAASEVTRWLLSTARECARRCIAGVTPSLED